jgi:hypothetical protein
MQAQHAEVCDRWSRQGDHQGRNAQKIMLPNYPEFRASEVRISEVSLYLLGVVEII